MWLPYKLVIVLLDTDGKEMKTYVHTISSTQIFIDTSCLIAKNWKQAKCLSVDEWLNYGTSIP